MRTVHEGIVDTLIGFRAARHTPAVAALRESDKDQHHPHGYMFKDVPAELTENDRPDDAVAETLALMDRFGIAIGMISMTDARTPQALRDHPDRFIASLAVDGNRGMDQIREIVTTARGARPPRRYDIPRRGKPADPDKRQAVVSGLFEVRGAGHPRVHRRRRPRAAREDDAAVRRLSG